MIEEREPDEQYEVEEADLGEPTESVEGLESLEEGEAVPDPADRERDVSETRKPMGPPLDEEETLLETDAPDEDDEPRSPPVELDT
jgi:hypothetical protein